MMAGRLLCAIAGFGVLACGATPPPPSGGTSDAEKPEARVRFAKDAVPETEAASDVPAPRTETTPGDPGGSGAEAQADAPKPPPDGGAKPDLEPPPDIPKGDTPCIPSCAGKTCGSDGCGGICGYCPYPKVCNPEGACVIVCEPQCKVAGVPKNCGGDGCGGYCGSCPEALECGEDGFCYEPECQPSCQGAGPPAPPKVCGPDGCGGDCGACAPPKICVAAGACELGPCGTVSAQGECQGQTAVWCKGEDELVEVDCTQYAAHSCKWNGAAGQYMCMEAGECVPKCQGKQCGGDSCGGVCGVCTEGWSCVQGACKAEGGAACGSIMALGECDADVLWWCSESGVLYSLDCAATGFQETCGWDTEEDKFDCVPD